MEAEPLVLVGRTQRTAATQHRTESRWVLEYPVATPRASPGCTRPCHPYGLAHWVLEYPMPCSGPPGCTQPPRTYGLAYSDRCGRPQWALRHRPRPRLPPVLVGGDPLRAPLRTSAPLRTCAAGSTRMDCQRLCQKFEQKGCCWRVQSPLATVYQWQSPVTIL